MTYGVCDKTIFCKAPPFFGQITIVLVIVCCLHAVSATMDSLQDLDKQSKLDAIDFLGLRNLGNVSTDRPNEGQEKIHEVRRLEPNVDLADRQVGQSQNSLKLRKNRILHRRDESKAVKNLRSLAKNKFQSSKTNEETKALSKSPSSTLTETNIHQAFPQTPKRNRRTQMPKKSKRFDSERRKHAKDRKRRSPAWMMNTHMVLCETGLNPNCRVNNSSYGSHEY